MHLLHRGFDGLDVSVRVIVHQELLDCLLAAKLMAIQNHRHEPTSFRGIDMLVSPTGIRRSGYPIAAAIGEFADQWWFKWPNSADPWGIRVSHASATLTAYGLEGTWARMEETLDRLGFRIAPSLFSIGRADYAIDVLIPGFEPDYRRLVVPGRTSFKSNYEIEIEGISFKVKGLRVGKNPHRQVAIYDKGFESRLRKKIWFWEIWNRALADMGLPPLDHRAPPKSSIWRIEFRIYKVFLKRIAKVVTLDDFRRNANRLYSEFARQFRYTEPSADQNRARWRLHEIWKFAREAIDGGLNLEPAQLPPGRILELERGAKAMMLNDQMCGVAASYAALKGVASSDVIRGAAVSAAAITRRAQRDPKRFSAQIENARARHRIVGK